MRVLASLMMVGALVGTVAIPARSEAKSGPHGVKGTVESIQNDSVTVKTADNKTQQLSLTKSTRYFEATPIPKEDVKKGQRVQVLAGPQTGRTVQALAIAVLPSGAPGVGSAIPPDTMLGESGQVPSGMASSASAAAKLGGKKVQPIVGTVDDVQGDKLTVATKDGTREIETSSSTRFVEGRKITKDDVKQGEPIRAYVKPQGGTLEVISLAVMPSRASTGSSATGGGTAGTGTDTGGAGTAGSSGAGSTGTSGTAQ